MRARQLEGSRRQCQRSTRFPFTAVANGGGYASDYSIVSSGEVLLGVGAKTRDTGVGSDEYKTNKKGSARCGALGLGVRGGEGRERYGT